MTIHVLPDGAVRVDAPEDAAVRQRARWLWQQLEAQQERRRQVLPREYVSGESHFYLGRRFMLKIRVDRSEAGIKFWRGCLVVTTPQADPAKVRRLLDAWYR